MTQDGSVVIFRSQILKEARERLESPQVPTSPGHVINRPLSRHSLKMSYRNTKVKFVDDGLAASWFFEIRDPSRIILPQNLSLIAKLMSFFINLCLKKGKNCLRCICVTSVGKY